MAFGRNPHPPRAQAAEQKALDAPDDDARARAYREAAHQWDRAAEREPPGKQRKIYEENATRNRALADGEVPEVVGDATEGEGRVTIDPKLMN
jgi:hypothetical protein